MGSIQYSQGIPGPPWHWIPLSLNAADFRIFFCWLVLMPAALSSSKLMRSPVAKRDRSFSSDSAVSLADTAFCAFSNAITFSCLACLTCSAFLTCSAVSVEGAVEIFVGDDDFTVQLLAIDPVGKSFVVHEFETKLPIVSGDALLIRYDALDYET